jgi:nitroreductase
MLDAAIRAPSGGNAQDWHYVLVDSAEVKAQLGPLYRHSIELLWTTTYADRFEKARAHPDSPRTAALFRTQRSAQWLADHFEEVPLYLFAFTRGDPTGGSIFPAVWSAQLAARAEGIGSALTVVLGIFHPAEVTEILGIPDAGWNQACLVSFGYPTGRWAVAERRPVHEVAARNSWDGDLGFIVDEPLWP